MIKVIAIFLTFYAVSISAKEQFEIFFDKKQYDFAVKDAEVFLRSNPQNEKAYQIIIKSYRRLKYFDKYFEVLKNKLNLFPVKDSDKDEIQYAINRAYNYKDYKKMLFLTQQYSVVSKSGKNYNLMGVALFYLRKYEASIGAFNMALLYSRTTTCYINLGRSYFYLHQNAKAIFYTRKALDINPESQRAIEQLKTLGIEIEDPSNSSTDEKVDVVPPKKEEPSPVINPAPPQDTKVVQENDSQIANKDDLTHTLLQKNTTSADPEKPEPPSVTTQGVYESVQDESKVENKDESKDETPVQN